MTSAATQPQAVPAALAVPPPQPPPQWRANADVGAEHSPGAGRAGLFAAQPHIEAPALRKGRPPDASWLQWIADNRLRGCTIESMLQTMAAAGLDPGACLEALRAIEASPGFVAARKLQQLYRKLESVLANQQRLWQSAPDYGRIEKRGHVSRDEFIERLGQRRATHRGDP